MRAAHSRISRSENRWASKAEGRWASKAMGPLGEQLMFLSHSCRSPTLIWMDVEFVLWERFATWERFTTR